MSANVPEGVSHLYRYTTADKSYPERVQDAELMREAALKCAEFIGVPRVRHPRGICALRADRGCADDHRPHESARGNRGRGEDRPADQVPAVRLSPRPDRRSLIWLRALDASNYQKFTDMGRQLWDSVYEPHHDKLLAKLGSFHPDFPGAPLPTTGLRVC